MKHWAVDCTLKCNARPELGVAIESAVRLYMSHSVDIQQWESGEWHYGRIQDTLVADTLTDAMRFLVWKSDQVRDLVGLPSGKSLIAAIAIRDCTASPLEILPPISESAERKVGQSG